MDDEPMFLAPGEGRAYELGPMRGVFKASGRETDGRYCASTWSVEPHAPGPGPHHHDEQEEVFVVLDGTMSFLIGDHWIDAAAGAFVRIPAGVTHDFANRTGVPATAFNVFMPDMDFETDFARWAAVT